jgi:hypothetical protein
MAQPIIVAGATTDGGAAVGPVQFHGDGPYSRTAGCVKRKLAAGVRSSMSFALCADGHIVPRFDCETRPTIDEQPAGLAQASRSFSERRHCGLTIVINVSNPRTLSLAKSKR